MMTQLLTDILWDIANILNYIGGKTMLCKYFPQILSILVNI